MALPLSNHCNHYRYKPYHPVNLHNPKYGEFTAAIFVVQ